MGSGCSSPKGSEFGGGGNLGSPTSGQHGDGVHQKPSFGNPASVASIDTGARARDGKEDARSPKMGKAMMLFADATPKNLNVVLDDPGFYLRFFKYETEKVPCGEVAERAFEALFATTDEVDDGVKVMALKWLGFSLQQGKLQHKKDFDWKYVEHGHFFQLLNPIMSAGLVNETALQRGEYAMNLLTMLCEGDVACRQ